MKAVSSAYKQGMDLPIRNRSFAEITFANVDTTAPADSVWISRSDASYSTVSTLDYDYDYQATYATLELNRWTLDGTQDLIPLSGYRNDGYVSGEMSNENGIFITGDYLSRKFENKHRIVGLTLSFGNRTGEWISGLTVSLFLSGEMIEKHSYTLSGHVIQMPFTSEYIDEIRIKFNSSLPYRRARLENVMYGIVRIFDNEHIKSIREISDVDPLSRRLPKETFTFSIFDYEHNYDPDNPTGIYSYIDTKSPVSVRFGYEIAENRIEWLKNDHYVLDSKPTVKDNIATFTATGLIGGLTDIYYKSKLGEKNFYDMAQDVLMDAKLPLTRTGQNPWIIDESLKNMFTTAVLPVDTHMNCLQMIAHACRCRLFTDDDNLIHMKPFGVNVTGIYRGKWSDNGDAWFSTWDNVETGQIDADQYASLELNMWTLDGTQNILSDWKDNHKQCFVSDKISDAEGKFAETPIITKVFDVTHDLSIITLRFDSLRKDHPTKLRVKYFKNEALLDDKILSGINTYEYSIHNDVRNCNKIEIHFLEMLPYSRPRIEKVYYRETDFSLGFSSITKGGQSINKIDELRAVSVEMYSYTPGNVTTLFEGSVIDTDFHLEFNGVVDELDINGTVLSSNIYGRAIDLKLSEGTKNLVITGKTLTENCTTTTTQVNTTGEVDIEKNPLITNETMRDGLSEHVIKYLTMRNTYDNEYRGNPEIESGDIIGLQTEFTGEINALVLVDELSFDGSLSGKLKVKGLL